MSTADFLRLLRANRITLFMGPNGRLRWRAPRDAWTPFLKSTLAEYLPEIIYLFNERAAIMEYDGRSPRAEAERRAAEEVLNEQEHVNAKEPTP